MALSYYDTLRIETFFEKQKKRPQYQYLCITKENLIQMIKSEGKEMYTEEEKNKRTKCYELYDIYTRNNNTDDEDSLIASFIEKLSNTSPTDATIQEIQTRLKESPSVNISELDKILKTRLEWIELNEYKALNQTSCYELLQTLHRESIRNDYWLIAKKGFIPSAIIAASCYAMMHCNDYYVAGALAIFVSSLILIKHLFYPLYANDGTFYRGSQLFKQIPDLKQAPSDTEGSIDAREEQPGAFDSPA